MYLCERSDDGDDDDDDDDNDGDNDDENYDDDNNDNDNDLSTPTISAVPVYAPLSLVSILVIYRVLYDTELQRSSSTYILSNHLPWFVCRQSKKIIKQLVTVNN